MIDPISILNKYKSDIFDYILGCDSKCFLIPGNFSSNTEYYCNRLSKLLMLYGEENLILGIEKDSFDFYLPSYISIKSKYEEIETIDPWYPISEKLLVHILKKNNRDFKIDQIINL